MEFYKQHIESDIKQFNSSIKNGLNENTIQLARQKFDRNVLKCC